MHSRHLRLVPLIAVFAIGAFATAPAVAQEEAEAVPPDNSAVNQYTEAFPTAGGNRDAFDHDRRRTPREVLGGRRVRELERRGPVGEEVAELVAETAPADVAVAASGGGAAESAPRGEAAGGSDAAGDTSAEGGSAGVGVGSAGPGGRAAPTIEGSSGIDSAVSAALGSSGGSGALLPLALLITTAWALLYAATRGRRTAE